MAKDKGKTGWLNKIRDKIANSPYAGVFAFTIIAFLVYWVYFHEDGFRDFWRDLLFSMFTESIVVFVTLLAVKLIIEKREKDHNEPIYISLSGDTLDIHEKLYKLADEITCRHLQFLQVDVNKYKPDHASIIRQHNLEKNGHKHKLSSEMIKTILEHSKYVSVDRAFFVKNIKELYNEVENYLQRNNTFLVSKATEEAGSELSRTFRDLRSKLKELLDFLEESNENMQELYLEYSAQTIYIQKDGKRGPRILHVTEYDDFHEKISVLLEKYQSAG